MALAWSPPLACEWLEEASVRPVPPPATGWTPKVGELAEFLYLDGWWPVRVKRPFKDSWEVVYEPFKVIHKAPLRELRPVERYNPKSGSWVRA